MSKEQQPNTSMYCNCRNNSNCFKIESILTVDSKGQVVIPKDIRDRLGFNVGEKIALIVLENNGAPCCITLMKASLLSDGVKGVLEPIMK